ncbi:MAG TPA: ribonuclease E inhibitor RraB [Pyrinomonadaceae bacterium]
MSTDEPFDIEWIQFTFERVIKAGWNPKGDLLWGYFFLDTDVNYLERLGRRLESLSYRVVDIFELEEGESGRASGKFMLHVEKVEIHTEATLRKRNVELARLAAEFEVQAYDGWDVGPVE